MYRSRRARAAWLTAAGGLWAAAGALALVVDDAHRARWQVLLGAAITVSAKCVVDGRAATNYRATLGLIGKTERNADKLHALSEGLVRALAAAGRQPGEVDWEQPAQPALRLVEDPERGKSA